MGSFIIYKASAGSGKTFQLTRNYLEMLLRAEENYRSILAVTFTNKAASELKDRVLDELVLIAQGEIEKSLHFDYLSQVLNRDAKILVPRARKFLSAILEDYSHFSIGTIDEFFQQILRSFARDLGVYSGYTIELNSKPIIEEAVDRLVVRSQDDPELFNWFRDGIGETLDEGHNWRKFERDLVSLGDELMKERLSELLLNPNQEVFERSDIKNYNQKLFVLERKFEKAMADLSQEARNILEKHGLDENDFSYKKSGPAGALLRLADKEYDLEKKRKYVEDAELWVTKSLKGSERELRMNLVHDFLHPLLKKAYEQYEQDYLVYRHAKLIRQNLLRLGLISSLAEEIGAISREKGVFLISFTNPIIAGLIRNNPAPFIYERTGKYFQNFMIDEFQDTSDLQWYNFLPLIREALASEGKVTLVGDPKQSIYRWRNGNWQLLANQAESDVFPFETIKRNLRKNFRSRASIVDFNNQFFGKAVNALLDNLNDQITIIQEEDKSLLESIAQIYSDIMQEQGKNAVGGFVSLKRVENERTQEYPDHYGDILALVTNLQNTKGYSPADIVFLVRRNKESADLIRFFDSVRNLEQTPDGVSLDLISGESLSLGSSAEIRSIISLLSLSVNPKEITHLGELIINLELARSGFIRPEIAEKIALEDYESLWAETGIDKRADFFDRLQKMVVPDRIEYLSRFLSLDKQEYALPFLYTFKEEIRNSFTHRDDASTESVLDWWEERGKTILTSMDHQVNAMRTMTIHKAKGLEFPVVILPDANWSLDHDSRNAPFLWLETRNTLFDDIPVVPLKYSSVLAQGPFSADYNREKIQVFLDNLNLLYVAFTRARDRLHVYIPERRNKNRIGDLIGNIVLSDSETGEYTFGDAETVSQFVRQEKTTLKTLPVQPGSFKYAGSVNHYESEQMVRGKKLHAILEHIEQVADLSKMDQIMDDLHILDNQDRVEFNTLISRIVNHPDISLFFQGNGEVYAERSILMPGSGVFRPDRVIVNDNQAAILEYKTGAERMAHRKQLESYIHGFREMGYQSVKAYLVYLDSGLVVSV